MKKLIRYVILPQITETEVNQTIELNKLNTEMTHKENNIPENKIIQETHHEEIKPETNLKNKRINWLFVFRYVFFLIFFIICLVCVKIFFFTPNQKKDSNSKISAETSLIQSQSKNSIFKIYINAIHGNFHIFKKGDSEKIRTAEHLYIRSIFSCIGCFFTLFKVSSTRTEKGIEYTKIIEIDFHKIKHQNRVIFYACNEKYNISFLTTKTININLLRDDISLSDQFLLHQQEIKNLNPNINDKDQFVQFMNHFIEEIITNISENNETLKQIKDPILIINTGLTYFPEMTEVKAWKPQYFEQNQSKNSIIEVYMNEEQGIFRLLNKGKDDCKKEDQYILMILYLLSDYFFNMEKSFKKIAKKKVIDTNFKTMTEIDLSKIEFKNSVFFYDSGFFDICFLEKPIIKNLWIGSNFKNHKESINQLNPKIHNQEQFDLFANYFVKYTKEKIEANKADLEKITDPTTLINKAITHFAQREEVKAWDPPQQQSQT